MSASLLRATATILIFSFVLSGCTRMIDHRIALYSDRVPPTTQPAPETAVYSIKMLDAAGKKVRGVDGSRTLLNKGDPIGFSIDDTGTLHAIAGTYTFVVDVPENHSLIWSARYRRSTQFGREVGKAADTTMDTTAKVLIVIGLAAIVSAASYAWYREHFTHDSRNSD